MIEFLQLFCIKIDQNSCINTTVLQKITHKRIKGQNSMGMPI